MLTQNQQVIQKLQMLFILIFYQVQQISGEHQLISYEFPRTMTDSDPNIATWILEQGDSTTTKTIQCFDGTYFGPFGCPVKGSYPYDGIPNMILKKTYTNLPPHWSVSYSTEMSVLWSPDIVPITWYLDNQKVWYQKIQHNNNYMNAFTWGQSVDDYVCDNTNISNLGTPVHYASFVNFVIPYFNVTHTSDTLEVKVTATFHDRWEYESLAFTDMYVHVDTCHFSCKTCNGPANNNCLTCPVNSQQNGQVCTCNTGYKASEWECILDSTPCQNGYEVDINNYCVESCPVQFCQTCVDLLCTQCNVGYYLLRGICVEECPFYAPASGPDCIDTDYNSFTKPFVVGDYFIKNTITNQDYIVSGFQYLFTHFTPNYYTDGYYDVMSRIGEKCLGKNVVGGRGPDFSVICNPQRTCLHKRTFENLPPHYSLTVRIMLYIFDSWDVHWIHVFFDGVKIDEFYYGINRSPKVKCGQPIVDPIFQDSLHSKTFTRPHTSSTFLFEISPWLDGGNGDESFGFREFSLILELCENPLCLTCSAAGQECNTCNGLYRDPANQCQCNVGFREDYPNQFDCIPCANDLCDTCQQDSSVLCSICIGVQNQEKSRIVNECQCPDGYWDNFSNDNTDINCIACINNRCQTCVNGTQCQTCVSPSTRSGNLCQCIDGYYDKSLQDDCVKCDIACLTCSGGGPSNCDIPCQNKCLGCQTTDDGCIQCRGNRLNSDCLCPDGYWETFQENCEQCHETCDGQCNKTNSNCTGCMLTRILDITVPIDATKCECDPSIPGLEDSTNRTFYCTTCDYAVLDIKFITDLSEITIDFADVIAILDYNGFQENSQEFQIGLCSHLFTQQTLDIIGEGAMCRHNPLISIQLQIKMGQGPTILPNDEIQFKQGVIERQTPNCIGTTFSNFILNTVQEPDIKAIPSLVIKGPTSAVTICYEIILQATEIVNDGFRGLFEFTWSLNSSTASDTSGVQQILSDATAKNQNFIKFPPVFLEIMKNYKITLQFKNFVNTQGSALFSLNTLGKEGTSTSIIQTSPFLLKNYKINQFNADIRYFDCSTGILEEKDKALDTFWEVIMPDTTVELLQNVQTQPYQRVATYEMDKYSFTPGVSYHIQLRTEIPGGQIDQISSNKVLFEILQSELLVYIIGGSRSTAYNEDLDIEGVAKDIDIKPEFQTQGLTYQWSCENMSDPSPTAKCRKIDGVELTMTTTTSLHFDAKNLEPYKSFLFKFEATNASGNTGSKQVAIVVVENNLPMLTVNIPENAIADEINKNDDLQIDIVYTGDPDAVFFSLSLFYNYDIVATKRYAYTSFSFKIWDLFDGFVGNNNEILVRVSMYDPNYFMPSQSSYNLKINLPPKSGTLTVTPSTGIAAITEYQISLEGYFDLNSPLSYKYHIYTNTKAYQTQKEKGNSPLNFDKHVLKDFTNQNQFTTKLPQAQFDIDTNQYDLQVMVSVSDSNGAIFNVTQIIQVDKPSDTISSQLQNLKNQYDQSKQQTQSQQFETILIIGLQLSQIDNGDQISNCNNQGNVLDDQCQCNSGFYSKFCIMNQSEFTQYNQLKYDLYKTIDNLRQYISSQAIKDQSVKVQKLLLQGDDLISLQSNSDLTSQLAQVESIINEKQEELQNIINSGMWNTGDSSMTRRELIATGILGSYIGLLDKLQKGLNVQSRRRLLLLNDQELNQNLLKIQILQKKIDNALQTSQLPNSDKISYVGESTKKTIQKSTNSQIQQNFFTDQTYLEGFDSQIIQKPFFNAADGVLTDKIFKASQTVTKNNPYRLQNYPYPDQDGPVQDINISLSDLTNNSSKIDILKPVTMVFSQMGDNSNDNVCISQSEDLSEFDNSRCKTDIIEQEGGNQNTIKCDCDKLSPSTVISDVNNLFKQSNLDEIFGDEGLKALAEFEFWNSVIFYAFVVFTSIFIFAIYKGYKKDQKDKIIVPKRRKSMIQQFKKSEIQLNKQNQIVPLKDQQDSKYPQFQNQSKDSQDHQNQFNDLDMQSSDRNMKENQQNKNNNNSQNFFQNLAVLRKVKRQSKRLSRRQKQKLTLNPGLNNNQNNENMKMSGSSDTFQKNNFSPEPSPNDKKQFLNLPQKNQNSNSNSNEKQQTLMEKSDQNSNISLEENNTQPAIVQINDKEELETIDKKLTKRQEVVQFVLTVHQLLGIIYLYDSKLSRPARYSIIYSKICLILAFSSTMASSLNQYYQILWSVLIGILSSLPILIIKILYQKGSILKILATILVIGIIGLSLFIALTNAALMEIDKSNEWATTYISSMIIDQFFFQIWIGWFKLLLFNYSIGIPSGFKIRKILNLHRDVQQHFTDYTI